MRAVAAGVTDVGKERDHNEDRFVLLPEFEVFVVADGMGGHQCGEVASRMATSTIASFFRTRRDESDERMTPDVLHASVIEANERIHQRATHSPIHRGMGTTIVAAAFDRSDLKLYVAHAGDSRCYRLRDGALSQVTRDHSLVEEALRTRPDITEAELAYLPANVITRALGVEPNVEIEVTVQDAQSGDVFLLCSDGLHGFVTDERIHELVAETSVLTTACGALITEANKNGGGDNITAVLVRIEDADEPWRVATSVPPPRHRMPREPVYPPQPTPNLDTNDDTDAMPVMSMADAVAVLETDDTGKMPALTDLDHAGFQSGDADGPKSDADAPVSDAPGSDAPGSDADSEDDSGPPPSSSRQHEDRDSLPPPSAP